MIKKIGNVLGNRLFFLCVLMVTLLFDTILLVHDYTGPIIKVFLIWGSFVIFWDIVNGHSLWKTKPLKLLMLFCISYGITTVITDRYYLVENIKTLAYMLLFFIILYGHDPCKRFDVWKTELSIIMKVYIAATAVLAVVCLGTFLLSVEGVIMTNHGEMYIGMCENRLWGVYNPNAGATINLIAILFSIGLLSIAEKHSRHIFLVLNIIVHYACLLLTGSRTSLYTFILCIGMFGFLMANKISHRFSVQSIKGFGRNTVLSIIIMIVLLAGGSIVKNGLAYLPPFVNRVAVSAGIDLPGFEDTDKIDLTRKEVLENREGGFLTGRTYIWKAGLTALKQSPIFGISKEATYDYAKVYVEDEQWHKHMEASLHNLYITVLVASGTVGFVIFMIFLVQNIFNIVKTSLKRKEKDGYFLFVISAIIVCGMLIIECTEARVLYRTEVFNVVFWTMCGYAYNYVEITHEKNPINALSNRGDMNE